VAELAEAGERSHQRWNQADHMVMRVERVVELEALAVPQVGVEVGVRGSAGMTQ
jgi:hypothetical protein